MLSQGPNAVIPANVQSVLARSPFDIPSFDEWLSGNLSAAHQQLYAQLMESRFTSTEPFPVDFDELWRTIGFAMKHKAVELLDRDFIERVDFVLITQSGDNSGRGRPAHHYALTIDCAQRFALAAGTDKGKEIRNFFVKTLESVQAYHLLTLLADQHVRQLKDKHDLLVNVFDKKHVVYRLSLGCVDGQDLEKVGSTDDLRTRAAQHSITFGRSYLIDVIETRLNRELEKAIKADPLARQHRINKEFNKTNQTEIYFTDDQFTRAIFGNHIRKLLKKTALAESTEQERMLLLQTECTLQVAEARERERREMVTQLVNAGLTGVDLKETLRTLYGSSPGVTAPQKSTYVDAVTSLAPQLPESDAETTIGSVDQTTTPSSIASTSDEPTTSTEPASAGDDLYRTWIVENIVADQNAALNRANVWRRFRGKGTQKQLFAACVDKMGKPRSYASLKGSVGWAGWRLV